MSGKEDVYSRLYNPNSYTGVYAERFRGDGDGRINAHTDLSLRSGGKGFSGNTNTYVNLFTYELF